MKASEVKPKEWLWNSEYPIKVLYDDGINSLIWGQYKDKPSLGSRWNDLNIISKDSIKGEEEPTWFVEPDFLAMPILQRLLSKAIDSSNYGYYDNILFAISELNKQLVEFDNQEE